MKISLLLLFLVCNIANGEVTYTKDVKPLFENKCSYCHGKGAWRDWTVYKTAYMYRCKILDRATNKKDMPPPYMKKQLTEEDRTLIKNWVTTGAKE